jgi:hypothetical protein
MSISPGLAGVLCVVGVGGCCKGLSSVEPEKDVELSQTYEDAAKGVKFAYPAHWGVDRDEPSIILVSGHDESKDDSVATVNVQVIEHTEPVGQDEKVKAEVDHLVAQFEGAENGRILERKDHEIEHASGEAMKGTWIEAEYTLDGVDFKQYTIVVPAKDPDFVIMWAYTNHRDGYDKHRKLADRILTSLVLTK